MFLRCKSCHGTFWLEPSESTPAGACEAECETCGQRYEIQGVRGRAARGLAAAARELARQHEIDLPGAYSVLLKIVSLEKLIEVSKLAGPTGVARAGAARVEARRAYDPDFEEAIRSGLLTPGQAMQRGGRETFATYVARRHDLSLDAAYAVADNRISLLEALRLRKPPEAAVRVFLPGGPSAHGFLVPALLLLGAFLAIQGGMKGKPAAAAVRVRSVGEVGVRTDKAGQIVEVRGPNPRSVLQAFCVSVHHALEQVAIVPSSLNDPDVRLGLLRDPKGTKVFFITIHKDRSAGGWVAGDGDSLLLAIPAPPRVVASISRPVTSTRGNGL